MKARDSRPKSQYFTAEATLVPYPLAYILQDNQQTVVLLVLYILEINGGIEPVSQQPLINVISGLGGTFVLALRVRTRVKLSSES